MLSLTTVQIGGLVVFSVLTVLLLAWTLMLIQKQKNTGSTNNGQATIYKAVELFAYKAIIAAYRAADKTLDEFEVRLNGLDKKAIADRLYDMIPPDVYGVDVRIIKALVNRQKFSEIVEDVFREVEVLYENNKAGFEKEVAAFVEAHKPSGQQPF